MILSGLTSFFNSNESHGVEMVQVWCKFGASLHKTCTKVAQFVQVWCKFGASFLGQEIVRKKGAGNSQEKGAGNSQENSN